MDIKQMLTQTQEFESFCNERAYDLLKKRGDFKGRPFYIESGIEADDSGVQVRARESCDYSPDYSGCYLTLVMLEMTDEEFKEYLKTVK